MALEAFHDAMHGLLSGRVTPASFVQRLGPSPSGPARLAFYRTLIERNVANILAKLQPATHAYFDAVLPGTWREVVRGMEREHPPAHYDPNRFGEPLSGYLERHFPDHPAAAELADYEWLLYAASSAEREPTAGDPGLEHCLFVRHYDYGVVDYARTARNSVNGAADAPPRPSTAPPLKPGALLVYRDAESGYGRVFHPTPLALMVLARLAQPDAAVPASEQELENARAELVRHGVLPRGR
jgi:hypothetical protein